MIDLRQTKEWADWLADTGWRVDMVGSRGGEKLFAFIRPMPLLPIAFLKLQRFGKQIDWKSLDQVKKKHRVLWSVLEPSKENLVDEIKDHGYHLNKDTYTPARTRIIDLSKSENEILSEMSENFRRIIKKGAGAKMVQISADQFHEGWRKWAKSYILPKHQFDSLIRAFGKGAEVWAVVEGKTVLSAVLLLETPDTCFYYQTWTSKNGRQSNEHVVLVWETIRKAKLKGKKFYNFEGIQDRRFPIARWDGFTEFKRRFGGAEVEYPGSFMKWF